MLPGFSLRRARSGIFSGLPTAFCPSLGYMSSGRTWSGWRAYAPRLGLFYVTSRTALLNRPCMPPAPFALPFAKPKQMSCILDMSRSGMTAVLQMACTMMGISSASSARQPLPPLSSYRPIALASMASAALQLAMLVTRLFVSRV